MTWIAGNTIVIYTTDNGPNQFSWPDTATTPFRSEKDTHWEGAFRVPAMVRWPGHINAGEVSTQMFSGLDWFPTLLAAAADGTIKDRLLQGTDIGGTTFKVHLDGYNQLGYLTGAEKTGPRADFAYFDDDGDLVAYRHGDWKAVFEEQKKPGGFPVWYEPLTAYRIPEMFNLRMDPYERADVVSDQYDDWRIKNAYLMGWMNLKAGFLQTFINYPPSQAPASFTIDQVQQGINRQIEQTEHEGGGDGLSHDPRDWWSGYAPNCIAAHAGRPAARGFGKPRRAARQSVKIFVQRCRVHESSDRAIDEHVPSGMVWVPGGTFRMGSDRHYPEEAPAHSVSVDGFWIDRAPVTNSEFHRFVRATGHVTVAELVPKAADYPGALPNMLRAGSLVFTPPKHAVDLRRWEQWWQFRFGANWRRPYGPRSSIAGLIDHPVVHVAWRDVLAYAEWAGKELPTEAEWEFAARGGLDGSAEFAWGDEFTRGGRHLANTWQGNFPHENLATDGYERTSPIGAFPPNGHGLYDMIGNVWEWTSDWYSARHGDEATRRCCIPSTPRRVPEAASYDPAQPEISIPRKVLKGGSHLCAANYCRRYRPAARHAQPVDTSTSHVGFRCVLRQRNG
jgi:formylglycine-generating enzyme